MGGDAKNGAGVELFHAWGFKTDHGETAAERVGREIVLPIPGGGHEGSGFKRCTDVNKHKAEHSRTIHCNVTASIPLQWDDTDRGARVAMRWWDQKGIDWEKAKSRGAEME